MSEIVVRADNLSKLYRIRQREPYYTLRDAIAHAFTFRWFHNGRVSWAAENVSPPNSHSPSANGSSRPEFIWALKDIGFEVKRGEVVGIIGRNGAGKSTLLKVLSGITEPTQGCAQIRGRVGSLLEVGTGFHPELTGRENIYLNGAILGMKKAEISRKFDEIVAFAEIEKFLDTPVKHYSSGMYMRLAFSVAAHLEPEILLVDEVLAVGDAAFQKKCLGKMEDVAKEGRTVLFVSHNLGLISSLCKRGILLAKARIVADDRIEKAVDRYVESAFSASSIRSLDDHPRDGSGKIRFRQFSVTDDRGNPWLSPDRPAVFRMTLETEALGVHSAKVTVAFAVSTIFGERLIEFHTKFDKEYQSRQFVFGKETTLVCSTKDFPLKPGVYGLSLYVDLSGELCDRLRDVVKIEVCEADYFGTGVLPLSNTQGWLMLEQHWRRDEWRQANAIDPFL